MKLVVLGSGTVAPSSERTAPSYWIAAQDTMLLLECGAGTMHRAAQFSVPWHRATHVAISHFHVDHWGELPALIFALRWGIDPPRSDLLTLVGPTGLTTRLRSFAGALGDWVLEPGFPLEIVEIEPGATVRLAAEVTLETHKTTHTEQSVAFAVRDREVRLVYTGDTGPDERLADWAQGCDLLLAECSLPDEKAIDIHLTPARAGELAARAHARELVLSHFYPVFGGVDPAAVAATIYGGPITAARDGDRFDIEKEIT